VPGSDLPSVAVLYRSSEVLLQGAVSMFSGSLYSSTCRVAVICFPCITVASVSTRKDVYAYIDLTVGPSTHETENVKD
jgi:hypothetical protein